MYKTMLGLLLLAMSGWGLAQAADPVAAGGHDLASAHVHGASPKMDKMWQEMLTKPALASSLAFDGRGRLWRVSVRDGHVFVSRSDDMGKIFSQPIQVNPEAEAIAADGENRPKIVVADKGIVYVSYTQALGKPFSGNIRFSRSLDGGLHFSTPITVNDNREIISHRFEAMAVNQRGQVFLAWLDKRDASAAGRQGRPYEGAAVYYAVSDDGGAGFGPNRKVIDHSCECCRVAMALDTDGVPVVFWRQVFGKNTRDHALVRLDGKSTPVRVSYDNWRVDACPHHGPAISIAGDGIYHLVWFDNAPDRHGLFYAHSLAGGKRFSTPVSFGRYDNQASHPDVLSRGKDVFIVWKEFDGDHSEVFLMHSRDGGASWGKSYSIATTGGNSDYPRLVADASRVFMSWNTLKEGLRLIDIEPEAKR